MRRDVAAELFIVRVVARVGGGTVPPARRALIGAHTQHGLALGPAPHGTPRPSPRKAAAVRPGGSHR
ncbi:hypothetical protein GCM10027063_14100 [Promicromonospora xylanilytica]